MVECAGALVAERLAIGVPLSGRTNPMSIALRRVQLILLAASLLLIGGCAGRTLREIAQHDWKVGPEYVPPPASVADDWIDSANPRLDRSRSPNARWWENFGDPVLNQLVELAYNQNLTLREAGWRIEEARARRGVVAGNLYPQLQEVQGDYVRTHRSTETALFPPIDPSSPFANLARTEFSNWRIGGALAWELDFWGRYRRAIESADARLESTFDNFNDASLLLFSEVSITYIELRTVEQRLEVARNNLQLQEESVRVAQARLDARAQNSELDTPQAKANLYNTRGVIEAIEIQRRQVENRICVLLGIPPQQLNDLLATTAGIPLAPEAIAVGIPAELLRRRPDVRRAERLVAAQSAQIGVAESELYPRISLAGTLGWEAKSFSDMFNGSAFSGAIGPGFRWAVLNYGRLMSNVLAEDARFQQLVANCQQTVLRANEEAENAQVAYQHYLEQIKAREESVRQAEEAQRVAQIKYLEGEIDFNRLFTVQQLLLNQQELLAVARGNSARAVVDLYRALGGGWDWSVPELPYEEEVQLPISN